MSAWTGRATSSILLVVIGLSGVVGILAGRANAAMQPAKASWSAAETQIAGIQRSARESSDPADATGEMKSLGVQPEERQLFADALLAMARNDSLTGVRVTVIPRPDQLFVPARRVGGESIQSAGYALSVEFTGRFADARKFVNSLPPSVSIWRLDANRVDGGARYQLVLSVYERHVNSRH